MSLFFKTFRNIHYREYRGVVKARGKIEFVVGVRMKVFPTQHTYSEN
jgi:hypothetical protein